MSARASNHPYKCSDGSQMPYYNNSVPSGENDRFYVMQNNVDHHYSSSDDGPQRINNPNPRVFEAQYCTLESSSANGVYPAQSSTSSHSISPISGSPLSQHDSHSDHTYSSPPSASSLTEIADLQVKLKELENAILGPELDITSDTPESFLQANAPLRPDNWRQLLGIDTGDLRQAIIACGKAVAKNDVFATELLISELGQLVSVSGDPMQRLGAYILEGVVARLSSSGSVLYKSLKCKEPTSSELMSYMHLLYEICPFYKFGYMSANGAIAEAIKGANFVHIIDFQIAQGSQWVTLIQALAARPGGPPCVRITGIDDSNSAYARGGGLDIVGMRLHSIAQSCGLPFEFNAVPAASHEVVLEHLDIRSGEVIAVNFAYQLHHVPDESVSVENHRDRIIRMIKSINPRVVTLVEQESNTNTAPFFPRYMEILDYYTAMFESIDVALPRDDRRRISAEQHCVARDIVNLIACEGAERVERHELFGKWKARFVMASFRPYPLSSVVNSTIKILLQSYNSCYRLEERDGVLYLGWKNRVLVVSSAWC
ncbi:scarecrow-like protein 21 [Phragmites australis]|uniref:scarecrow-like protein 21 n=1 Tax=Phragmites australis TaxID=29695 RepID=UPI002D7950EB|nr:scarecrow-like protein 21 [Phragmites australis]